MNQTSAISTQASWLDIQTTLGFQSAIPAAGSYSKHQGTHHYLTMDITAWTDGWPASVETMLLAAFAAYLARLTGQQAQVFAVLQSDAAVGMLALEVDLASDFSTLLASCQHTYQQRPCYPTAAFDELALQCQLPTPASAASFTQLGFASYADGQQPSPADWTMLLGLCDGPAGRHCQLWLAAERFSQATADSLFAGFMHFFQDLSARPTSSLTSFPLAGTQVDNLLALGQSVGQPNADISDLISAFRQQVHCNPDLIAVREQDQQITYRQLDEQSDQLAACLSAAGVVAGDIVALLLPRSVAMVQSCLAVLKLGAAYAPVALQTPEERLAMLHQQCRFAAIVSTGAAPAGLSDIPQINPHQAWQTDTELNLPAAVLTADSRACVLFTSGSTGQPKGVILRHGGLSRIALNLEHVSTDTQSVVAFCNNTAFDACSFEIWLALLNGATLAVITAEQVQVPLQFGAALQRYGVTHTFLTVALVNLYVQVDPAILCQLKALWFGGEVIPVETCRRLLQHGFQGRLIACYGPTENSVFSTTHLLDANELQRNSVALGRACVYSNHYVLDGSRQLVPLGTVGELYLAGAGLAEGYLGAAELTAKAFMPDPFAGGMMYRSGDLVWLDEHGVLHFVGRVDNQVKIRGHRIEPEEIQVQLGQHPAVAQCHVQVLERRGQKYLAAYLCLHQSEQPAPDWRPQLLSWLAERLPAYMLPSSLTLVQGFALNANGKIDKTVLPAPSEADHGESDDYQAPVGAAEVLLASLWHQVLQVEVGRHDNFFRLGGDSIAAMKVIHLAYLHGYTLSPAIMMAQPELAAMASRLQPLLIERTEAVAGDMQAMAATAQQRMYFMQQLEPHSVAYNLGVLLRSQTPIDATRLQAALAQLLARHPALSQGFFYDGAVLWRQPRPFGGLLQLPVEDPATFEDTIRQINQQPYDLERDCLFRAVLFSAADETVLYLGAHHAIVDGWSLDIVLRELHQLYHGQTLTAPALSYDDFCQQEQRWLLSEAATTGTRFWADYLAENNPASALPADLPKKPEHRAVAALYRVQLDASIIGAVHRLAKTWQTTPFNLLLTAFYSQLSFSNGERQLSVGTAVAGREWGGFAQTVGMFVNTVVLNQRIDLRDSFADLCRKVSAANQLAFTHQQVPYEQVQHALSGSERLFNVMFDLQNTMSWGSEAADCWQSSRLRVAEPQFDLTVTLEAEADGLAIICEYDSNLYQAQTISQFIDAYHRLLTLVSTAPEQPLNQVLQPGLFDQQLFNEFATLQPAPHQAWHYLDIFDQQVHRFAEAIAVQDQHTTLTYRALDQAAAGLARALVAQGVQPDQPVAVHLPRGHRVLVAMLAIMKAGACYLPLDIRLPAQRIRELIEDQQLTVVITDVAITDADGPFAGVTLISSDAQGPAALDLQEIPRYPQQLAYVLFTSGTTGKPKGAMTTQQGMVNHNEALLDELAFTPADCFVQTAALSFDISVWQHLAPLMRGARVAILSDEEVLDPLLFLQALTRYQATLLQVVPVQLQQLIEQAGSLATDPLQALRLLIPTGEALPPSLARSWFSHYQIPMVNAYGPAECSDDVTLHRLSAAPREQQAVLPIGKPIRQCGVYLLDEAMLPVPVGAIGEICITGEVVLGRGYLNAPALTANAFVANPYGEPGSRLYKTGDLGRFNRAGELEFVGRRDFQIKIRGMRIEIGEIESVMETQAQTSRCIVRAEQGVLLAYLESRADTETLRSFAQAHLPEHMVPAYYVVMANLPVTANGKVDRKALPKLAEVRQTETGEQPIGMFERFVAGQFAALLGLAEQQVYRDAHFFRLGGHSLLAMRLISALRKRFSLNDRVTVKAIFTYPQLADLAAFIAVNQQLSQSTVRQTQLAPAQWFDLSQSQQQMLWFEQLQPGTALYNMPNAWLLQGRLCLQRLQASVLFLQQKHPILRARIDTGHGRQCISADSVGLRQVQLDATVSVDGFVKQVARQPFVLTAALFEPILAQWPSGEQVLIFNMHHLISDAWSSQLMLQDLMAHYHGQSPAPASAFQYADFVQWQQQPEVQALALQDVNWWRDQLQDVPHVAALPTARKRPQQRSFAGKTWSFELTGPTPLELQQLALQADVSLSTLLLAAYTAYMALLTGSNQLLTGIPVAGRNRVEFDDVAGLFVNTLPFKADVAPTRSFAHHLQQVRQQWLMVLEHQHASLEAIIDALAVERIAGINPLIQLMFNFEQGGDTLRWDELSCREIVTNHDTAKFDCLLAMSFAEGRCQGHFELPTDLFDDEQAQALTSGLAHFLTQLAARCHEPLACLSLVDPAQQAQLLQLGQTPLSVATPACDLVSGFLAAVDAYPTNLAIDSADQRLTYQQLDQQSSQLAHYLLSRGLQPADCVAIMLPRSADWIVAALAILKAGATYVPLDPAWPAERLSFVVAQAGIRLAFCQAGNGLAVEPVIIPAVQSQLNQYPTGSPCRAVAADTVANIIYTSGSTGQPKGVVVTHTGISRLVLNPLEGGLSCRSVVAFMNNPAFDGATFEIWSALLTGACLAVVTEQEVLEPQAFAAAIRRAGVDYGFMTVALFNQYVKIDPTILHGYQRLWIGGEALSVSSCRTLLDSGFSGTLCSGYGPTENTIFSLTCPLTAADLQQADVPLGHACALGSHFIMNQYGQLLPLGVPGELCLAGAGVALGYLARPELTSQVFLANPFGDGRYYRSGDQTFMAADGTVRFLGRIDHQVKIRGHRIEPGELRNQLDQHPQVDSSFVVVQQRAEQRYLAAYIVPKQGQLVTRAGLLSWLQSRVAQYLLPSTVTVVEQFVLTKNGKIDVQALPLPAAADWGAIAADDARPLTAAEQLIADIWYQLLGQMPAAQDNFFALGGNSILLMQLVNEIKLQTGVVVSVAALFQAQELSAQALLLQQIPANGGDLAVAAAPADFALASPAQCRMYFMQQLEPDSTAYHIQVVAQTAPLDSARLQQAITALTAAHPVLAERFVERGAQLERFGGAPCQLQVIDADVQNDQALQALVELQCNQPFELTTDAPWRVVQIRTASQHYLVICAHHIALDGWSLNTLFADLARAYDDGVLCPEPQQGRYQDYCYQQQRWLHSSQAQAQREFWQQYLAEAQEGVRLPADLQKRPDQVAVAAYYQTELDSELVAQLAAMATRHAVTPFNLYLAAFCLALSHASGERDVVVGTVTAGRSQSCFASTLGMFVNTLAYRQTYQPQQSFADLLTQSRLHYQAVMANQQLPYDEVMQVLSRGGQAPLFNVMFDLQNSFAADDLMLAGQPLRLLDMPSSRPQFDFTAVLQAVTGGGMQLRFEYDAGLYQSDSMARFANKYLTLLTQLCQASEQPIAGLKLLDHHDLAIWQDFANVVPTPHADQHYLDVFADSVARFADKIAVEDGQRQLSYAQLAAESDRLAAVLLQHGAQVDRPVGVHLPRGCDVMIAMLAIFKAGGCYLPLDTRLPAARIRLLLEEHRISQVITDRSGPFDGVIVHHPQDQATAAVDLTQVCRDPAQLAYVLFTSGTTGKPKGAMTTQRGMVNHNFAALDKLAFSSADTFAQTAGLSFDISVWQYLGALMKGGTVAIFDDATVLDPLLFLQALQRHRVSILQTVPVQLQQLLDEVSAGAYDSLADLRHLIPTGEALPPEMARRWFRRYPAIPMMNAYGPAECSDDVTLLVMQQAPAAHYAQLPIGKPVYQSAIFLLDKDLLPVPQGAIGEICVAGEAVLGRGYLNAPALTANAFVANPYGAPGSRLYKTGDLGRYNQLGELEFLGRRDFQVKIRGMRIEMGEIESVLEQAPQTSRCVVSAEQGVLVAYLESQAAVSVLQAHAAAWLPDYMVPAHYVLMPQIPVTQNGKVDRKALPSLAAAGIDERGAAPLPGLETLVAAEMAQVLNIDAERIGRQTDFFRSGGHSLLAMRLISSLRRTLALGTALTVKDLFERATPAALAALLVTLQPQQDKQIVLQPRLTGQRFPLSAIQQQMVWFEKLQAGTPLYNMPTLWRLTGELSTGALQLAVHQLQQRHDMLRARLDLGTLEQYISDAYQPLQLVNVPSDAALTAQVQQLAACPFDFSGALFMPYYLRSAEGGQALCFLMHHAITDAWSSQLMLDDLQRLLQGESLPVASAVSYADVVLWQQTEGYQQRLAAQRVWWQQQLAGATTVLSLPSPHTRPQQRSFVGYTLPFSLDAQLTTTLQALAQQQDVSLFMLLLAAYSAYLSRLTGQTDLIVGVPVAGREQPELESIVGLFVNTLPLRTECQHQQTFNTYLAAVKQQWLAVLAHQDIPFEQLVDAVQQERFAGINPLVQTLFTLDQQSGQTDHSAVRLEEWELSHDTAKFDLLLAMAARDGCLSGEFEFAADVFPPELGASIVAGFSHFISQLSLQPQHAIASVTLVSAADARLLQALGQPDFTPSHAPVDLVSGFAAVGRQHGQRIALKQDGQTLTYQQLDERANQLAHYLQQRGVQPAGFVAIAMARSIDWIVAALAIIKTGAAYVPLDANWPAERIDFVAEQANISLVFVDAASKQQLKSSLLAVLEIGQVELAGLPAIAPFAAVSVDSVAHVIYTSGSTGLPKGVITPHRGISRLVLNPQQGRLTPDCVVSFMNNPAFDGASFEIWSALLSGASLAVISQQQVLSPGAFGQALRDYGVNYGFMTVALFNQYVQTDPTLLHPYDVLWTGGEVIPVRYCRALLDSGYAGALCSAYGPTENSIFSTTHQLTATVLQADDVPLGRACAWSYHLVMDEYGCLLPLGVPGELYLGGEGVAHGYLQRPELTARAFVADPWQPGLLYRSGDRVSQDADGVLHFIGRTDNQVKIRGHRIEPEELQVKLNQHPAIEISYVQVQKHNEQAYLAAYVQLKQHGELTRALLLDWLSGQVTQYLMPSTVTFVQRFALNANGKIDAKVLPVPDQRDWGQLESDEVLTGDAATLAQLWFELLGKTPGWQDSFFTLGGNSLLAMQLVNRVKDVFAVELPIAELFLKQRLSEQTALLATLLQAGATLPSAQIIPAAAGQPQPLSFAQERLWFLHDMEPESLAYHLPVAYRIKGQVKLDVLYKAIELVADRHQILKTRLLRLDDTVMQLAEPTVPVPFNLHYCTEQELDARLAEAAGRPFDLLRGPVFRVDVFMLGSTDMALLLNVHHAMADGWSLGILAKELQVAYGALAQQQQPQLPALQCQYSDFAAWQRANITGETYQAQLDYWRQALADAPDLQLATDRPRQPVRSEQGATYSCPLPADLLTQLRQYEQQGYSGFMVMLAAYATLLQRYSGQDDIVIGSPVAGRTHLQLEPLIGFFVNMLPVRVRFEQSQTFVQLLNQVQQQLASALANQQVPFERIVQEVVRVRDTSRTPVFQAVLSYQDLAYDGLTLADLAVTAIDPQLDVAKYDLLLNVMPQGDAGWLTMEYSSALFDESTIADMLANLVALLRRMLTTPQRLLNQLPLLCPAVEAKVRGLYQRPRRDFSCADTTHSRFEQTAARYPEHVAIVCDGQSIRYQLLNQQANRLAWQLIDKGVTAGSLVGVCVDRSINMLIAILAVMKAGGAYVPLDPTHPQQRIDYIMQDAGLSLVLGDNRYRSHFAAAEYLDIGMLLLCGQQTDNPPARCGAADLTYVIYTSGSTGTPKGVLLEHRHVIRLFDATAGRIPIAADDVWSLFSSCTFDFSVWEIWGALFHGGKLVIVPYDTTRNSEAFHQFICQHGVTQLSQTPSAFLQVVRENLQGADKLPVRRVVLGGEEIDYTALRGWFERYQDQIEIINMYGITEITVHATHRRIWAADVLGQAATASLIGDGIADLDILVLDEHQHWVPVGVAGEIYVAGAGLARGYLNLPELTAQRFMTVHGERMYRSGDLARVTAQGDLEYLGRCDNQVKIRGFRIELGEIEALLTDLDGVDEALVMAHKDAQGQPALVAYVMSRHGRISEAQIRLALQQRLPEYMVPAYFVLMDVFPLTANGKVDRRALPEPTASLQERLGELPQTVAEQFVATVFAELLGLTVVYRDDNFFEIGGHSLLATRVIARLQQQFNHKIAMRDFFMAATVRQLAAQCQPDDEPQRLDVEPLPVPAASPQVQAATQMQQSFWISQSLLTDKSAYNMPFSLLLAGDYDPARIRQAVGALWQRHLALRVFLRQDKQGLWQYALPANAAVPFERIEVAPALSLIELAQQHAAQPFGMDDSPLFRAVLLTQGRQACLQFVVSHLIADGWSLSILAEDFMQFYQTGSFAEPPAADYWQYQDLSRQQAQQGLTWWQTHLHEAPQTHQLPLQTSRDASRRLGARQEVVLDQALTRQLEQLAQSLGMSSFMLLLAAWQLVQHQFTGETDIVTGFPVSGRVAVEFDRTVGLFVNTLPLRGNIEPELPVETFLRQIRDSAFDALDHQLIPLSNIVEAVAPPRIAGMNPLFQITFSLHNLPSDGVEIAGLQITPVETEPDSVKLDLCWFVQQTPQGMVIQLEYDVDLFELGLINSLLDSYQCLLSRLPANLATPVHQLTLVSASQLHQLQRWSRGEGQWPVASTLHGEFELQAQQTPDAIAVEVLAGETLTYQQLDETANALAHLLQSKGITAGARVALCLPRTALSVIAALAVLKIGAAYIGLDPELPAERLSYILTDSAADLLLCTAQTSQSGQCPLLYLDDLAFLLRHFSRQRPLVTVSCEQLAYVIYTSGTTGQPKGTLLHHQAVMGFARNSDNLLGITAGSRVLQFASIAFDSAVLEFWAALMNGATLLLASKLDLMPGQSLARTLQIMQPNFAILFPSVLANTPVLDYPALTTILTAGEAPSYALLQAWSAPNRRIINAYGPSETGVGVCLGDFDLHNMRKPHMGIPRPGSELYVLNDQLRLVPPGAVGTLYIGGPCVGLGYWRKPEITAARFVQHPQYGRLYNSGDLVRYDGSGNLVFIGRADNQIKLRGYRIELEEIEAVLCSLPTVSQAAVIPQVSAGVVTALAAYVVSTDTLAQVKAMLQALVPVYMVPQLWCALAQLPTDVNGKVKRAALPPAQVLQAGPRAVAAGDCQQTLLRLWQEVLGHAEFGVQDNFFDVGGHSILVTRLQAAMHEVFAREIDLLALFKHTTIVAQAKWLSGEPAEQTAQLGSDAGNKRRLARQNKRKGTETC